MALPEGVTTCTVIAGVPVTFTGAGVKAFVSIEPSVDLVHIATGTPLIAFIEELDIAEGVAGQYAIPHTDQSGFQDENGNAYTNWYYTAKIIYRTPSGAKVKSPKTKIFQLTTGQVTIDLDKLPGGAPALPYTAPTAKVDAFNGRTGTVTFLESDLPDRLDEDELNATFVGLVQAAKNPDLLVAGAITRDGADLITSAVVAWPDGTPGTLTITSRDGAGNILAYNITYGSPVTKTFTQPAITRNATGSAINVPQIVVS